MSYKSPEELEQEADQELKQLMSGEDTNDNQPKEQIDDGAPQKVEPPENNQGEQPDWQTEFQKAEESRKNAHSLMTKATQEAAEARRQNEALNSQMAQLQSQLAQLEKAKPEPVDSGLGQLETEYEELAPLFQKLKQLESHNQDLRSQVNSLKSHTDQTKAMTEQERFWAEVKKEHPDVHDVSATDDFQGWFNRQTEDVKQISGVNPAGAIHVMSLYKAQMGVGNNAKLDEAQKFAEPNVRSRTTPTTRKEPELTIDQIANMSQAEFDKNEAKVDEALKRLLKQG